jgi:hypothetical protein
MKSAAIYLHGIAAIGDKRKAIKTVKYDDEKMLISHLKELQKGYCEEGTRERSKITKHTIPRKEGGLRIVIDCHTSADWHHVAYIGCSIKPESGKPVEILN